MRPRPGHASAAGWGYGSSPQEIRRALAALGSRLAQARAFRARCAKRLMREFVGGAEDRAGLRRVDGKIACLEAEQARLFGLLARLEAAEAAEAERRTAAARASLAQRRAEWAKKILESSPEFEEDGVMGGVFLRLIDAPGMLGVWTARDAETLRAQLRSLIEAAQ